MKDYDRGSIHISFRAAKNLDAHLDRLAASLGVSKSELIRRTLWQLVRTALIRGQTT